MYLFTGAFRCSTFGIFRRFSVVLFLLVLEDTFLPIGELLHDQRLGLLGDAAAAALAVGIVAVVLVISLSFSVMVKKYMT